MATEAQRKATQRHSRKQHQINLKYEAYETEDYFKIKEHCKNINMTIQAYLKMLAREDMKHWN